MTQDRGLIFGFVMRCRIFHILSGLGCGGLVCGWAVGMAGANIVKPDTHLPRGSHDKYAHRPVPNTARLVSL